MLGLLIGWYVLFVSTPDNLSSKICNDLKNEDFVSEWQSFTPNEQVHNGSIESVFVENRRFENQLTHGVVSCTTSSATRNGDSASSQITIVYGGGEREVDILYMVNDRGTWLVDSIQQVSFYQQ
jgi:hypothetical protein